VKIKKIFGKRGNFPWSEKICLETGGKSETGGGENTSLPQRGMDAPEPGGKKLHNNWLRNWYNKECTYLINNPCYIII